MTENLLTIQNLTKHFPVLGGVFRRKIGTVHAVENISFDVKVRETVGIIGESGCGKTTLGRTLLRLYEPTNGKILFHNQDITQLSTKELNLLRRKMQIIFQDPFESLNTRHSIGEILEEPLKIHRIGTSQERHEKIKEVLSLVGLPTRAVERFPFEFSGGQRQRIGIARAMILNPELLICDEPVSALDVSVQAQVLNLLLELQDKMRLTYIFISHDLSVVKYIADRIAVMYLGRIIEWSRSESIYKNPLHPYTQALISAIPIPDPETKAKAVVLEGEVPSPIHPPSGCHFHPRCPYTEDRCRKELPELRMIGKNQWAACHLA